VKHPHVPISGPSKRTLLPRVAWHPECPASKWLLNHDGALRPLADAEFEALATSYDLESDPVAVYPSTGRVAGNPKAALVEHLSPEHRDALDDDVIQHWAAS
jgi:hypothetical protein